VQGIEKGIVQGIEKGIVQGIEKGIVQGIEKGRELASEEMILIISEIKENNLTIEQIAEKHNTSQERVIWFKSLIS
jgi:flagellar biosynthesis/type III secretory pathway protein FliH